MAAEIGSGSGIVDESYNRRLVDEKGKVKMLWNNSVRVRRLPVDNEVGVISIRSAEDKRPLALLVNYSAHPVISMNFKELIISGDYPGALAAKLNRRIGGETFFLLGAVGDTNAYDAGMFETATREEVFAAVDRAAESIASEVERVYTGIERHAQRSARFDLVGLSLARRAIGKSSDERVEVEVATLVFGDEAALAFMPGEPFVELGIELKRRSPVANTYAVSQANGAHWYFPTMKATCEGGYGADSATIVEVGAGEKVVNEALLSLFRLLDMIKPLKER